MGGALPSNRSAWPRTSAHDLARRCAISKGGRTSVVRTSARQSGSAAAASFYELAHLRLDDARRPRPGRCGARAARGSARDSSRAPGRPRSARRAPSRGRAAAWPGSAARRRPSSSMPVSTRPALAIASTPSCGCEPCAARPGDLDLEPGEALVGDAHLERGRLRHDRRVGAQLRGHGLGADARELLVAHGRDDDVARELELARPPRRPRALRPRRPSCRRCRGRTARSPSTRGSSGRS